jgi:hypothetical protein
MLIKRGNAEIMDVIKDDEHNLDDEGTRKVLAKAEEEDKKTAELKSKPVEDPNSLVN